MDDATVTPEPAGRSSASVRAVPGSVSRSEESRVERIASSARASASIHSCDQPVSAGAVGVESSSSDIGWTAVTLCAGSIRPGPPTWSRTTSGRADHWARIFELAGRPTRTMTSASCRAAKPGSRRSASAVETTPSRCRMPDMASARIGQPVRRASSATSCGSTPLAPPTRTTPRSLAIHATSPAPSWVAACDSDPSEPAPSSPTGSSAGRSGEFAVAPWADADDPGERSVAMSVARSGGRSRAVPTSGSRKARLSWTGPCRERSIARSASSLHVDAVDASGTPGSVDQRT